MSAYAAFDRVVAEADREGVMTAMCEEAHVDGTHEHVTILDRDRLNAINVRVSGIIGISGQEYTFQMQDGDRGGTELLEWESDKPFEYHTPTVWTIQPQRHLVDDAILNGRGSFLIAKWDIMIARPEIQKIPRSYSYDRHFAPGLKTETYWRAEAAKHHFDLVCAEVAQETRDRLARIDARKDGVS